MKICPVCKLELGKDAYVTDSECAYEYKVNFCPLCGCELEDKADYERDVAISEQEDIAEEEALQSRLEAKNESL